MIASVSLPAVSTGDSRAMNCILPWTDIVVQNQETKRPLSRITLQSELMMEVYHIETAKIKNDVAAIKWLGSQRIDMSDRRILIELKNMKDIKVLVY